MVKKIRYSFNEHQLTVDIKDYLGLCPFPVIVTCAQFTNMFAYLLGENDSVINQIPDVYVLGGYIDVAENTLAIKLSTFSIRHARYCDGGISLTALRKNKEK